MLIVEDDPVMAELIGLVMDQNQIRHRICPDLACATRIMQSGMGQPFLLLVDLNLPDGSGLEVIRMARRLSKDFPCLVITGDNTAQSAVDAMRAGALNYFTKPFDTTRLVAEIKAVRPSEFHRRTAGQVSSPERHWKSSAMRRLHLELAGLIDSHAPLIIAGEPYSGKGTLAKWLAQQHQPHGLSRGDVNFALLQPQLHSSSLFASPLGSGWNPRSPGLKADWIHQSGILILRNIECLNQTTQEELGAALATMRNDPVARGVKLICTCSVDIEDQIAKGAFSNALWHQLSVHCVDMPPLRNRVEDIELLWESMITEYCIKLRRSRPSVSEAAMRLLKLHQWPGNLTEMKNAVEHAMTCCKDGLIGRSDLPSRIRDESSPTEWRLRDATRASLHSALKACNGNRRMTAEMMGVSLRTVYNLIKRHGDGSTGIS